ncbi:DUF6498-containing protein [Natribaculum luteum]|uniref:DUF6498-containing protein n=1 Tax=Natribaculum luteum TaxID=1586232 RepID=A0ABD5P011_9EURY|nr:DUF6498-containing protein [Natribaculum luteum]
MLESTVLVKSTDFSARDIKFSHNNMIKIERRRDQFTAVLSNLVLFVGVFVFRWDPHLILFFYWFEAGIVVIREVIQSLFAELPPSEEYCPSGSKATFPLKELADVRGGLQLTRLLPPIYPRNVPYALMTVIQLIAFWPFGGLVLTGIATSFVEPLVLPSSAALGILAIVGHQLIQLVSWFRSSNYKTVAATGGISKTYLALLFLLAFIAPVIIGAVQTVGVAQVGLSLILIGSKVVYDILEFRKPRFVQSTMFIDETVGEEPTVKIPDGKTVAEFHTDWRAALIVSLFRGILFSFVMPTVLFVLVGGLIGGIVSGTLSGAIAGAATIIAIRTFFQIFVGWITIRPIVYRVYPDAVVVYNRLTGEAQEIISREEIEYVGPVPNSSRVRLW